MPLTPKPVPLLDSTDHPLVPEPVVLPLKALELEVIWVRARTGLRLADFHGVAVGGVSTRGGPAISASAPAPPRAAAIRSRRDRTSSSTTATRHLPRLAASRLMTTPTWVELEAGDHCLQFAKAAEISRGDISASARSTGRGRAERSRRRRAGPPAGMRPCACAPARARRSRASRERLGHDLVQLAVDHVLAPVVAVQVLDPLEVADGDATGVAQDVGDHEDAAAEQDLVRLRRRRAVGGLGDDLGLDAAPRSRP